MIAVGADRLPGLPLKSRQVAACEKRGDRQAATERCGLIDLTIDRFPHGPARRHQARADALFLLLPRPPARDCRNDARSARTKYGEVEEPAPQRPGLPGAQHVAPRSRPLGAARRVLARGGPRVSIRPSRLVPRDGVPQLMAGTDPRDNHRVFARWHWSTG